MGNLIRLQMSADGLDFVDQSGPSIPSPEQAAPAATHRDVSDLKYGHAGSARAVHQANLDEGTVRQMNFHTDEANKLIDPNTGQPRRGSEDAFRRHAANAEQLLESARYQAHVSEQRLADEDPQLTTNRAIRELEVELAAQRLAEAQRAEAESLRRAGARPVKR